MAGSQHRSTNQPDAAKRGEARPREHLRHAEPRAQSRVHPSDAYAPPGELLEIDPAATVATTAVNTSSPLPNPPQQGAWPPGPQPSHTSGPARGSATTGDLAPQSFTPRDDPSYAPGFTQGPPRGFAPDVLQGATGGLSSAAPRSERQSSTPGYHPESDELPGGMYIDADDLIDGFRGGFGIDAPDEVDEDLDGEFDDDDEWAIADQPTANLSREVLARAVSSVSSGWLPPEELGAAPVAPAPDLVGGPRYASPEGDLMPLTPPTGIPRSALANPRMERFQELRQQRKAHERGERAPQDPSPVTERVRTWWMDLTPGLQRALKLQHEARASGMHQMPGYVVTVAAAVIRMSDAFGKLAVSTRELANQVHATASPTLRRMHDKAEAAAQVLIDKLEGSPVQQQASFLGPGRLAVLFKSGVTVGQAQRLLQSVNARPLRLIPRKHGFLALVTRGAEAQVAERLRQHPWVRDVIYMEYDDPSQSLSTEVPAIMGMRRM